MKNLLFRVFRSDGAVYPLLLVLLHKSKRPVLPGARILIGLDSSLALTGYAADFKELCVCVIEKTNQV